MCINAALSNDIIRQRAYCNAGMETVRRDLSWHIPDATWERNWQLWAENSAYLLIGGAIAEFRGMGLEPGLDVSVLCVVIRLHAEVRHWVRTKNLDYYWWQHVAQMIDENWKELNKTVLDHASGTPVAQRFRARWNASTAQIIKQLEEQFSQECSGVRSCIQTLVAMITQLFDGRRNGQYIHAAVRSGEVRFSLPSNNPTGPVRPLIEVIDVASRLK